MIALVIELIKSTSIVYKLLYTIVLPNLFLFVIFWWRRNKTNPFEKKRLNRYGYIALITSFIMWISYGSFSIDGVRTYGDIDDVKNAIEISLDELNNEYNELCSEKRNDQLKESFTTLQNDILTISNNCYNNKNLSYSEQTEAHNYYVHVIQSYPNLKNLSNGNISCW
jgi:hypothetical protein